jgi:hypothetical protein
MNDDKDTKRLGEEDESLAGDALLHAVLRDVKGLFWLVKALDEKVDARLHDTTPMWEVAISRLDTVVAEQESQGKRLDAIEVEQRRQGGRLDAIEVEQYRQGARLDAIEVEQHRQSARLDAIEGRLDGMDRELRHLGRRVDRAVAELSGEVVKSRMDQHDLEDRVEKLEKTPA